jgi:hypothetical protein
MNTSPTARVDIVASRLLERAIASNPNPLVRLLGGIAAPFVESQFRSALGPRTMAGKLAKQAVGQVQKHIAAQLYGMGAVDANPMPGKPVPPTPYPRPKRASATVGGKRVKFRKSRPGEFAGQTINIDAEVIG